MMCIGLGVLLYALNFICTYVVLRNDYRKKKEKWTIGERKRTLMFALIIPPGIILVVALVIAICLWFDFEDEREATW